MLLNSEKVTSRGFNKSEKAEIDLDKKLSVAFVRYVRYDVVMNQSTMTFKKWNDCPLLPVQVNGLITSFKVNGVNCFKASNVIPLVISKKYLASNLYRGNGNAMKDLKEIRLMDNVKMMTQDGKSIIYVASGQHHIVALSQYQRYLKKIKSKSMKSRKQLEKKSLDNIDDMEINQENKVNKPIRDAIDDLLAFKGQWIVAIYN